jgi:hypothetical protein
MDTGAEPIWPAFLVFSVFGRISLPGQRDDPTPARRHY